MSRFLIAVVLVAGLVLSSATAASSGSPPGVDEIPPGVGIRLVDAPVATADDPRARVYIIDHVSPGTVIERRVEISNGTNRTQQIEVYPGAAEVSGGSFTGAEGRTQNELSRWVKVRPSGAELDAGGRTMADVRIEVPRDASRGERYAAVWAEMTTKPGSGGITQISRVGIRIYLSVGPGGAPPRTSRSSRSPPHGTPTAAPWCGQTCGTPDSERSTSAASFASMTVPAGCPPVPSRLTPAPPSGSATLPR